ncbi:MAG: SprB repeat-containing protein [Bacteroidia bacterium]|nr:SprB repeat-containing protein [Bacteroidia bacterium]
MVNGIVINDATCGNPDGSATANVIGGVPPYSYQWDDFPLFQTTQTASNLFAGAYHVTVTDFNLCTITETALVNNIAGPVIDGIDITNVTCNGNCDGTATVNASLGSPPYSYLWSDPLAQTSQMAINLCPDVYLVTVTDVLNCKAVGTTIITEPAVLTASIVGTNVSCNGLTNGSANLTAGGGTLPFTYVWSNSATTEDIAGLAPNTYTVTVTDANNCTATANVAITEPAVLIASIVETNVSCNGLANGSANLTVAGGTLPYGFAWSNLATTEDIAGLAPNTYTVTVTDANNCTATANVAITEPAVLTASIVGTNVSCNGLANGSANLTAGGGTLPFTYAWSTTETTEDIAGLAPNTYTVTVTDAKLCTATASVIITEPAVLSAGTIQTNVSCNGGNNGSIDLTVSGGIGPYVYLWSNSATTEDISGLTANAYTVTVADFNNCTITASATITEPTVMVLTTSVINPDCGISNGEASVSVTGGISPYTYLWDDPLTQTNDTASGLAAGIYNVTVTDFLTCIAVETVIINNGGAPAVSISSLTNVSCNGLCDGEAVVSATGGTAPYSYQWDDPLNQTTNTAVNLCAGIYNVTILDANGCEAFEITEITEPDPLISGIIATDVLCNGDNNGSANVTVSGGTLPYAYLWNTGASTDDLQGVSAGIYSVTVTDNNNCTVIDSVVITEPDILTASLAGINVSCYSDSTGVADLTVTGGTIQYSYAWFGGETTEDLVNIPAGIYKVTVTDSHGCIVTDSIEITEPAPFTVNIDLYHISCFGVTDGMIDLTLSGGIFPYLFNWSNGETTEDITGLSSDVYGITATDNNGCLIIATGMLIEEPAQLAINYGKTDVSCNGNSDGSINLTISGGTLPYTYLWNTGESTDDLQGVSVGIYSVTVTDTNNCTILDSIEIFEPQALALSLVSSDVTCHGSNDGSADLTVTGGIPPYAYSWNIGATSEDLVGLGSGIIIVTVTDANMCIAGASVTINEPALLAINYTVTSVTTGNNGAITIDTVYGGIVSGDYNFLWSNGETTQNIDSLTAGIYTVSITDDNLCLLVENIIVNDSSCVMTISMSGIDVLCNGGNDGSASVLAENGTEPYSYLWNTSETIDVITSLTADVYSVTVEDSFGCLAIGEITIVEPELLVTVLSSSDISCFGNIDGTASVAVNGGIAPYLFNWSNGETIDAITGLSAGTYYLTVSDANSCIAEDSVTISEPELLTISSESSDVSCFGNSDGTALVNISGGVFPYTIDWSNGDTIDAISGLNQGIYYVTVIDNNGCIGIDSVTIYEPSAPLTTVISGNDISCFGYNNGFADVSISGGTSPYSVVWSTGDTTFTVTDLPAGMFTVIASDANGCFIEDSVFINEPLAPLSDSIYSSDVTCFSFFDGTAGISVSGGTAPYDILWSTGDNTPDISGLAGGIYYVAVTDNNGCNINDSISISEPEAINLLTDATDINCYGLADGTASVSISGGIAPYSINWSTGDSTANITGLASGWYYVVVTDFNGCIAQDSIEISEPAEITAYYTVYPVTTGNDGAIVIDSIFGGTIAGDYSILWSTGDTTQSIDSLTAGIYSVTITDDNSCELVQDIAVNDTSCTLTVTMFANNVSCNSGNDGEAIVFAENGTLPYFYTWNTGDTVDTISSMVAGDYSVTVTDGSGCFALGDISISEPEILQHTLLGTNATCYGIADGSADVVVTGAVEPYEYLWNTGDTTNYISGIAASIYYVTILDANLCAAVDSIVVTEPDAILLSFISTNITCNGLADGSVLVTASGGSAPYEFYWSTGDTVDIISNVAAGVYYLTVIDTNFCIAEDSVEITEPDVLTLIMSSADITCNGLNNGSADVFVTGGTVPYDYLWNTGDTTDIISNLTAGIYYVDVIDANLCAADDSIEIFEPEMLSLSLTGTDVTCGGLSDGTADVTITGGIVPYEIFWSTGDSTSAISGLAGGIYYVTVVDSNFCAADDSIEIFETEMLSLSLTGTNVTCNGLSDGTADVTITGGVPPYNILWSDSQITVTAAGLSAGIYFVDITDSNGCAVSDTIEITEPALISVNVSDEICEGDSIFLSGSWQSAGGSYYDTLITALGCDSVIVTELTVNPVYNLTDAIIPMYIIQLPVATA